MALREDRKRINVSFDMETYNAIKAIAHKENKNMSDVVREWALRGLNGNVTEKNLEVITPVIREQLRGVMEPMMERMLSLSAKACIQSGTATYLSADAILKFVPKEQREEVRDSYEKARKQAVEFMRSKVRVEEDNNL